MSLLRAIVGELSRALAVLAFAALSFAHQPLAVERYGVSDAVTNAFVCGSALPGDPDGPGKTRTACDACRIATAFDLPAPPVFAVPVPHRLSGAAFTVAIPAAPLAPRLPGSGPRAPPVSRFA